VVEHLPIEHKVLSSTSTTTKNKYNKNETQRQKVSELGHHSTLGLSPPLPGTKGLSPRNHSKGQGPSRLISILISIEIQQWKDQTTVIWMSENIPLSGAWTLLNPRVLEPEMLSQQLPQSF
jgi:hypothetical protein